MFGIPQIITKGFIWGAGITRPRQGQERVAVYYITGIVAGTLVVLTTMFFVLQHLIR
ncbi:hypothetical protein SAMN05421819_2183 [Bryocella elongata]|uniref:Uncharacterized protein n=1 Tax=Bryocella elongata TaxID=863522 RepID=A0A1H5Y8U0_9BACT|nr:hypothetical protein [Bryocella elongata]SEG20431.1 hypothetical protein SAMN05421819_2183 [Bryocella elongata]